MSNLQENDEFVVTVDQFDKEERCPKCGSKLDFTLVSDDSARAQSYEFDRKPWRKREDIFELLPDEIIKVSCLCGWDAPRLTLDCGIFWIMIQNEADTSAVIKCHHEEGLACGHAPSRESQ